MPTLDRHELPARARVLIAVVVAAGAAAVLPRLADVTRWTGPDLLAYAMLAAGIAVAEQFPIRLRYRTETLNFSMTEALWMGALLHARPSVLTLSVAAGLIVAQAVRRRRPFKAAFNVGQFMVAISVAQALYA